MNVAPRFCLGTPAANLRFGGNLNETPFSRFTNLPGIGSTVVARLVQRLSGIEKRKRHERNQRGLTSNLCQSHHLSGSGKSLFGSLLWRSSSILGKQRLSRPALQRTPPIPDWLATEQSRLRSRFRVSAKRLPH